MIGDGITDLEAVQTGGADLFIGYGGVVERSKVKEGADWYVYDYNVLIDAMATFNVAMIGSGAWACAAMSLIAQNCVTTDTFISEFSPTVKMWVYEEEINGQKLTDIINQTHENPKYLPVSFIINKFNFLCCCVCMCVTVFYTLICLYIYSLCGDCVIVTLTVSVC